LRARLGNLAINPSSSLDSKKDQVVSLFVALTLSADEAECLSSEIVSRVRVVVEEKNFKVEGFGRRK
jgi:hypothetical protein